MPSQWEVEDEQIGHLMRREDITFGAWNGHESLALRIWSTRLVRDDYHIQTDEVVAIPSYFWELMWVFYSVSNWQMIVFSTANLSNMLDVMNLDCITNVEHEIRSLLTASLFDVRTWIHTTQI